jgi:hypothetical protein
VIGRLEKTVIDCPDPRALAEFHCRVLGMRVNKLRGWPVGNALDRCVADGGRDRVAAPRQRRGSATRCRRAIMAAARSIQS